MKEGFVKNLMVACFKASSILPDGIYLKLIYRIRTGKKLNLKVPRTFNEKIQWIKVYDHNPIYTLMADKVGVRDYISETIGEEYLIPSYGSYNKFDEINFDKLPEAFVIKCSHDSGGLIICRNKALLDLKTAKKKIDRCMKRNFYYKGREWCYKDIKPRILVEKFMEDHNVEDSVSGLTDYKFYCFNGEAKWLYVARGLEHHETAHISFYDMDFKPAPFCRADYEPFEQIPKKPVNFELMKELAAKLSAGLPFLRVDLYEIDGKVYFSELTLYPCSGFMPFEPDEWDYKLGQEIRLK